MSISPRLHADLPSLELRLATRVAGALTLRSQAIPHDISTRLRFGREQALVRARESRARTASAAAVSDVSAQGTATMGAFMPWWQRAASVLPLLLLVSGMLMLDRWSSYEQVQAAAEIDAQLLSDTLPPAAYSDPGFAEFLKSNPTP